MPRSLFAGSGVPDDERALQNAPDQLSVLGLGHDDDSHELLTKRVNMTECVPVPSSEHVAEIVGRQGCKIKSLRAKTNTYIKTPARGEEPVFVVTGRREDVAMARREIISAAEHFSMIQASRNKNTSTNGSGTTVNSPRDLPGQTTIQVRVPYRVVGLVVGPKGTTIKRIQQQTHTYIVTPSRDKEPLFEVTGMPENVDRAREEIEAHIAMRTGGLIEVQNENDFHANGTDVGFHLSGLLTLWSKPNVGITPAFSKYRNDSSSFLGSTSTDSYFGSNSHMADYSPPCPALSYTTNNINCSNNNNLSVNTNANEFVYGKDAVSPDCTDLTFDPPSLLEPRSSPPAIFWSQEENRIKPSLTGSTSSISTLTIFPATSMLVNQRITNRDTSKFRMSTPLRTGINQLEGRVCADPSEDLLSFPELFNIVASLNNSHLPCVPCDSSASSSSSSSTSRKGSRDCTMCFETEVSAALVPCGHNLFCSDCANRICEQREPKCPICHTGVTQAIRIIS